MTDSSAKLRSKQEIERDGLLGRWFVRGNYANAYETEDYELARKNTVFPAVAGADEAFTLGFFATYEEHEMGEHVEMWREAYESEAGKRCVELGFIDARTEERGDEP